MSTISLMPLGKKMRVKRATRMNILSTVGSMDSLKAAGMLLSHGYTADTLILDEDSIIRIEGFSSSISDKYYPSVKISIFPDQGKLGQLYVVLNAFDGLTWENVEEDEKKIPVITKRIDVAWKKNFTDYIDNCRAQVFGGGNYTVGDPPKIINPLELKDKDFADMTFAIDKRVECGSAVVKIGRESFIYNMQYIVLFHFIIEKGPKPLELLQARFTFLDYALQIGPEHTYIGSYKTLRQGTTLNFLQSEHEESIRKYLQETHKI